MLALSRLPGLLRELGAIEAALGAPP
jgi:hypothetical protein